ncbi:uncharacterized protein LOC133289659 [Gastrolobium bilobum]|uniref:uncharacterized protein LOC133289659 n=1 Tax=Gastrolobium bilobum TaxID=150636 RepID=UPI002AB1E4AA|nr:uncharacterized protein LOC133289659 [Gastrolobium bilobum]
MVFQNKIQVLALLETRISGNKAERVIRSLGFDSFFIRDVVGYSASGEEENFTFIYGSPKRPERAALWSGLRNIADRGLDKWAVMGDFNAYLEVSDKQGGADVNWGSMQEFANCLSDCGLSDLGFSGPKFTWKRGALQERIDRLLGNEGWMLSFPNRSISHIHYYGFDHRPLVLKNGNEGYSAGGGWVASKEDFHKEAVEWHHLKFKEDQKKKLNIQRRIRGVDLQLSRGPNESLERLHRDLWQELNKIFIQEEITWFQRSRNNWLAYGDRNSRFFHATTVARNRRNKIMSLKDEQDEWIQDPEALKEMVIGFFKNLYKEECLDAQISNIVNLFPVLDSQEWANIGINPGLEEIRRTIFKM